VVARRRSRGLTLPWWFALAAWFGACSGDIRAQTVTIDTAIFRTLDSVATDAVIEHGACLYGTTVVDSVRLTSVSWPEVHTATSNVLNTDPCPVGAIAWWHNHIAQECTIYGVCSPTAQPLEAFLYLSRPDLETAANAWTVPFLQFVGVGHGLMAWWSRPEIAGASAFNMLPAFPSQRTYPKAKS